MRQLIEGQYSRNDIDLRPGSFRVRGDTLEIAPAYDDQFVYRISFFGDEVERITQIDRVTAEILEEVKEVSIFPAKHFITEEEKFRQAITDIEDELNRADHYI